MTRPILYRLLGATGAAALAVSLGACGQQANDTQMTAAAGLPSLPATLPLDPRGSVDWPSAPEVAALPAARPLRSVRVADPRDYYGYADAAYEYQDVLGDAPPDYYFDYDGVDPWAWEGYDQSVVFVEPIDGGYRSYYYRPGAATPYFVRDPLYGYGYDGDGLAVIYGSDGGVLPYDRYGASRDYAARYFERGRDLYAASRRADRRGVSAPAWAARQPAIVAARTAWFDARERQPQWRDFHERAAPRAATYWREEAVRRQADTQRFDQWRAERFASAPPPRAIPPGWAKAKWAGDERRFQPAVAAAEPAGRGRGGRPDRGQPPEVAAAPADLRGKPDDRRGGDRAMRGPAVTAVPADGVRLEQPRADRPQPRRDQPQAHAERLHPPARAERPQPQARAERPQPQARVERPQPQPRAERPQPQPRVERPQSQPRAERPQPQPQAQPRGNGGGAPKGGGGGGDRGGGGKGRGHD